MIPTPKPKWTEASMYKLYVSPVTNFDKTSLQETFSQYAEIVDVYISEPNDTGFKWAFVYFATEQGLEETVSKFYGNNQYNFKLSRARPKVFQAPGPALAPVDPSVGAKVMNGITKANGVPYTAPPNCVFCRKLTFSACLSCRNPFCSRECMLDGWRSHTGTGSCIKIAELVRIPESTNGIASNALTPTLVNFMKGCQYSKKKFTSDEFANACNYRKVDIPPPTIPKKETEYDKAPLPNTQPPAQDKGRRMAASLPKPSSPDLSHEDQWNQTENKPTKTSFKPQIKRNPTQSRKPNRKCMSENGDVKENTKSKMSPRVKRRDSDSEAEGSIIARSVITEYPKDDKRVDFRKKPNESKQSVRSKETRVPVARGPPETDLKLKPGESVDVVVTSILNNNTFFVGNAKNLTEVLQEILDCAERTPELKSAEINTLCLAYFDGEWYRARIVSNNPIEVEYIDYGNREMCELENLKVLPASLKNYLPLATKVQLKDNFIQVYNIKENEEIDIFVDSYDASSGAWIIDVL